MPTIGFAYSGGNISDAGITAYYKYEKVASGTQLATGTTYYNSGTPLEYPYFTSSTLTSFTAGGTETAGSDGMYIYASETMYELQFIDVSNNKKYAKGETLSKEDFTVKAYYAPDGTSKPELATSSDATQSDILHTKYQSEMKALEGNTASGIDWFVATVTNFNFSPDTMSENPMNVSGTDIPHCVKVSYGGRDAYVSLRELDSCLLIATSTNGGGTMVL